jgi:hypothetical protein
MTIVVGATEVLNLIANSSQLLTDTSACGSSTQKLVMAFSSRG